MNAALDLFTLGGLRVILEHEPVESFRSRTAEALLVYLVYQGRPLTREWLAEFFWPERPIETSQANLRVTLHRLQKKLFPYLTVTRQTVGIRDDNLPYLDSADFERLLQKRQLREALALYHGDFLNGFYLSGSPAFETWAASERERLRDLALTAYQELIDQHIAKDEVEEATKLARGLLRLDPLHEPMQRLLLRLLAQSGRRQVALEGFESYRKLLWDELGLEPDRASLELLERVRQGSEDDLLKSRTSLTPPLIPQFNFPLTAMSLLGRQAELATLHDWLVNRDCRLVTLTGPGGVGKTRLSIEAALREATSFTDGICFVPLAGLTSLEAIVPTIVQSLGLTLLPSTDAKTGLLSFLRNKQMLLVLDNFEGLVQGALLLLELLRHAPGLQLLVTSRERLALSGEWLMPLTGLPVDEEAVALFVQHAKRLAPSVDLSQEEGAIREICTLVDGFPLAIELAASWVGVMTCDNIVQEIRTSLNFLNARSRDVPERHRSVIGLFDASWGLLSTREQAVFTQLSVFRGGFTAAEAHSVAGVSLEDLRALTEKSLVRADVRGRFELHELIRQYAGEKLMAAGEAEVTARRHFGTYLALAEEAEPQLFGPEQPIWFKRLEREWDNFRTALTWGFEGGQKTDEVTRILLALAWFWMRRATSEAYGWLERGLQLEGLTPHHRAELLHHLGHAAWLRGELALAEAHLEQALEMWRGLGVEDEVSAARTRSSLAMTRYMQGDADGARGLLEVALKVFRREGHPWWTAFALGWRAKASVALKEYEAAKAPLKECLTIYRNLGNRWGLGLFLLPATQLHYETGDLTAARKLAEEARTLLEEINHKHALGEAYRLSGAIAGAEGCYAEAEAHYWHSLALYQDLGYESLAEDVAAELEALRLEALQSPVSRHEPL